MNPEAPSIEIFERRGWWIAIDRKRPHMCGVALNREEALLQLAIVQSAMLEVLQEDMGRAEIEGMNGVAHIIHNELKEARKLLSELGDRRDWDGSLFQEVTVNVLADLDTRIKKNIEFRKDQLGLK